MAKELYKANEHNLELIKECEILKTKIRFIESSSSTSNPRISSMLQVQQPITSGFTNLRMDDEEGEIFNNTHLTDLKTGGGFPPLGRESVW